MNCKSIWMELGALDIANQFKLIYDKNIWKGDRETICGWGSTLEGTEVIRKELSKILSKLKVKSFIDCGCGDYSWMSKMDWTGIDYIGIDIVEDMIIENKKKYPGVSFRVANILDGIPAVDVVFIRDVLAHLSLKDIGIFLKKVRNSGSKYLIASTYTTATTNHESLSAKFKNRNLILSPFNLPEPMIYLKDRNLKYGKPTPGRGMGVWNVTEL